MKRPQISLRVLLLLVALAAAVFSWHLIGQRREAQAREVERLQIETQLNQSLLKLKQRRGEFLLVFEHYNPYPDDKLDYSKLTARLALNRTESLAGIDSEIDDLKKQIGQLQTK